MSIPDTRQPQAEPPETKRSPVDQRIAVVLFNLGGPDRPQAVEPFLFNLFNDSAIIALPGLIRAPLARLIAKRRAPAARAIYERIGGRSPIVPQTEAQAEALEAKLAADGLSGVKVFIAMRYWRPRAADTVQAVIDFGPQAVILLPLYPQFSTTTTASSLWEWHRMARRAALTVPTAEICCYPVSSGFIEAHCALLRDALTKTGRQAARVLFSAHGLPERTVTGRGDPYPWQVEQGCKAIAERLNLKDWVICYQSRVGPLKWIGPSTEDEIRRAARDGVGVVLTPVAFVSEHSETLVELDIEYRELAERLALPFYERVPALGTAPGYIETLSELVRQALNGAGGTLSGAGGRLCPADKRGCPNRHAAALAAPNDGAAP